MMKMDPKVVEESLRKLMPAVASKGLVEQTAYVLFLGRDVGTYNDDLCIRATSPFGDLGEFAVPAETLLALMSKLTKPMELGLKDGTLHVHSGRVQASINTIAEVSSPIKGLALPADGAWVRLTDGLMEAASFCSFCTGEDLMKPMASCVHVGRGFVEACDNVRMVRKTIKTGKARGMTIPAKHIKPIMAIGPVRYASTEGWAHFKANDGMVASCRVVSGEFPDLERLLEPDGDPMTLPTKKMVVALERAKAFIASAFSEYNSGTPLVTIKSPGDGTYRISAEGKHGMIKEKVPGAPEGMRFAFRANPSFLCDVLPMTTEMTIGKNRLRFKGEDFVHVIAAFMLDGD